MADRAKTPLNYSDWLVRRVGCGADCFAIVVDSPCPAYQPPVGKELASYLNEFCDLPTLNCWQAFDQGFLQGVEQDQLLRQMLHEPECAVRALASLGGCILEGANLAECTQGLPHVFQVCLSCKSPEKTAYHLHLNQQRFEPGKIVGIIGDAFLEWAEAGGDPQAVPSLSQVTRSQVSELHLI